MKKYKIEVTRVERGTIEVSATNYAEAHREAVEYGRRIVLVDNLPWYDLRTVDARLIGLEK